jgi:hypothetical protein
MGGQAEQLVKMAALIPQVQANSYGNIPASTTHAPSRTSSTRIRGRTASGGGSGGSVHGFEESHRNLAPSLDARVSGGMREVNQGLGILEANRKGVLSGGDRKHLADCLTSFSLLSSSSSVHLRRAGGKEGGTMRSSQNVGPPSIDSLTDEQCVDGGVVSGSVVGMALADWDGKEQLLLKSLKAKWSKN